MFLKTSTRDPFKWLILFFALAVGSFFPSKPSSKGSPGQNTECILRTGRLRPGEIRWGHAHHHFHRSMPSDRAGYRLLQPPIEIGQSGQFSLAKKEKKKKAAGALIMQGQSARLFESGLSSCVGRLLTKGRNAYLLRGVIATGIIQHHSHEFRVCFAGMWLLIARDLLA